MATRTHIKTNNIWAPVKNIHVKDGGVWRTCKKVWVNQSGVWRLVHIRTVELNITSNAQNYNVKTKAETELGYSIDVDNPVNIIVNVLAGVSVGSGSTITQVGEGYDLYRIQTITGPALTIPALPEGCSVTIINNGYILGCGGVGGHSNYRNGQTGGTALHVRHPTTIINNSIIGGGGGGGSGYYSSSDHIMGGGAGAGYNGAPGQRYGYHGTRRWLPNGNLLTGNYGGNDPRSGRGGDLGQPGKAGNGTKSQSSPGAAGFYIDGNSFVTWQVAGDRRGRVS